MLAELRVTPVGSKTTFARLIADLVREEARKHADRVLIELALDDRTGAEGEMVRGLQHVRNRGLDTPLERLVRPGSR